MIARKRKLKNASPIQSKTIQSVQQSPTFLGSLIAKDEETYEKILVKMLQPDDVETKTEVQEPVQLTQLDILGTWLEAERLFKSANTVRAFAKQYRINMVSYRRKSREEVTRIMTEGVKQERTMTDKLMSKPS